MVLSGWMCFWECVLAADVITSTVRCFRACIPSWCNPGNLVFCKNFLFSRTLYSSLFIYLFSSWNLFFSAACISLTSSQCFSIPYYHQTVNSAVSLAVCDSLAILHSTNKASVCYIHMRERRLFMGYGLVGGWWRLWWMKLTETGQTSCMISLLLHNISRISQKQVRNWNSTPSWQSLHLFASTCCLPHRGSHFCEK